MRLLLHVNCGLISTQYIICVNSPFVLPEMKHCFTVIAYDKLLRILGCESFSFQNKVQKVYNVIPLFFIKTRFAVLFLFFLTRILVDIVAYRVVKI